MSHLMNPLVWTLFALCSAVAVFLLGRAALAALALSHDLAVLSESPETFDDAVGKIRGEARILHAGLIAVAALAAVVGVSMAAGASPAFGLPMALAVAAITLLIDRLHLPLENRARFLCVRYTAGKRGPAETIQPPFGKAAVR